MYVNKIAGSWACRPWRNGKRLYKSGFRTKAEAVAWGKSKQMPPKRKPVKRVKKEVSAQE